VVYDSTVDGESAVKKVLERISNVSKGVDHMIICQSNCNQTILGVLMKKQLLEAFIHKMETAYFKVKPYYKVVEVPKYEIEFFKKNTNDTVIGLVSILSSNNLCLYHSFLMILNKADSGKQLMDRVRQRLL